jgi:hypothetical protein
MNKASRRWLAAALLVGAALAANGCTPTSLGYLLMLGQDPMIDPMCPLTDKDNKNKEVKVVIIVDGGVNFSPELAQVDQVLATKLADILRERCKTNKEKVTVVPSFKVEAFRQRQRDWRSLSAQEIGKHFGADYVINLDIGKMSLYEEKSRSSFYRGRAEIAIKVIKVNAPEGEGLYYSKEYVCQEYPRAYPVETTSFGVGVFRQQFLNHVAEELSREFTAYPSERKYDMH